MESEKFGIDPTLPFTHNPFPLINPTPSQPKMSAEDLFDGAIGIDLGTTYSYESFYLLVCHLFLHLTTPLQLCGCLAK